MFHDGLCGDVAAGDRERGMGEGEFGTGDRGRGPEDAVRCGRGGGERDEASTSEAARDWVMVAASGCDVGGAVSSAGDPGARGSCGGARMGGGSSE